MPNLVPVTGNRSEKCLQVINAIETADAFINKATIKTTPLKRVADVLTANNPEATVDRVVRSKGMYVSIG
jgi:DNA-directed RNA polymerase specialized sigma54-like protein